VPDHAVDLGVHQFLCGGGTLLGIGRIVLGEQFELHLGIADADLAGVEVLDGHPRAQFVVLTQVRDRAGDRTDMADLHDRLRGHAARGEGEGNGRGEVEAW
jgi:hypothetical protein